MDHITRCPNCSTSFRVTDAQLAAFQGKVRCGKCAFVFNARVTLIAPGALAPETPAVAASGAVPPLPELETLSLRHPATPTPVLAPHSAPPAAPESIPATAPLQANEPEQPAEPTAAEREADLREEDPTQLMQPGDAAAPQPATEPDDHRGYRPIVLPEDEALFAPPPRPKHARWWTLGAVLAALLLLGQIAFAYRSNLVVEFPALQPRLTALCQTVGCAMPLPRKADLLRLEWSELSYVPGQPSLVQMSATLRNLAAFDQGLPLLEITLTDNQERMVARRILRPDEYLTSSEKGRPHLPRGDELHAFVQLDLGSLKSTGYSLHWFYE